MVSNLKKKKGTSGTAVLYCTRNQALSRLQLRLAEFRRLCILKGVHPREPKRKVAGQNKTYYHVKDVAFLQHEPLLAAFRAQRAHARKVRRAKGKAHLAGAERLQAAAPTYRLDGLVRERYPTFEDALRDLNDPLTLVHLFAVLPAERAHRISPERVHASKRCVQWVVPSRSAWCRCATLRLAAHRKHGSQPPPSLTHRLLAPHQPERRVPGVRGTHRRLAQSLCVGEGHLFPGARRRNSRV